ncbi:MAG: hypothetical protein R6V17_07590, partial [Halanaerobacter sp.]
DKSFYVKVRNHKLLWNNNWGNVNNNFEVKSGRGFDNVYTHNHNFAVRSTTSYNIDVAVDCSNWESGVVMNTDNEAIGEGNSKWYGKAFDVRMTDRHGGDAEPRLGSSNGVTILQDQSNTLKYGSGDEKSNGNAVTHTMWLDLVLVDPDSDEETNDGATNILGTAGTRRFDELPEGNYYTTVTLTVSEAL